MNEIDDGCFDWMIVLENKRKQRELQKEAEKAAELKSPQVSTPAAIDEKAAVASPLQSTFGMLGSPTTPNVVIEKTETPKSEAPDLQTAVPPQDKPIVSKKKSWATRLFCCNNVRD